MALLFTQASMIHVLLWGYEAGGLNWKVFFFSDLVMDFTMYWIMLIRFSLRPRVERVNYVDKRFIWHEVVLCVGHWPG